MKVLLAQTPNLFPTTIKLVPPTTLLYLGAIPGMIPFYRDRLAYYFPVDPNKPAVG